MRLLHAGPGDELRGSARAEPAAVARGCEDGHQRSSVPVRNLSPCVRGDARRGQSQQRLNMAPKEPMRRDRFLSGIAGVSVDEIERQVPASEAPPLPPNDRLMVIGKRVLRINARAKVTGAARFTVDIKLAGMLHGRLLRSPHAHARIVSIDTKAAERHPDVRAIHIITDVVGRAVERVPEAAANAARVPRALYVGVPIVAVAATTPEAAEAALGLIKVEYEVLPFVV